MISPLSAVAGVLAQRYISVTAITLVVYDIIITADREIQYFWGRSFTHVQFIYFLNRYYGLIVVAIYFYGDMLQVFPDTLCKRVVEFGAWSGWSMILLADAIMAIRVHALFEKTRVTTIALGSLYLVQGVAMMGMLIGYDRRFDGFASPSLRACGAIAPSWNSTFWIPTLIFEFLLLCMTVYKYVKQRGAVRIANRYSLHRILFRDQLVYFLSILASGCLNIALWRLPTGTPDNQGITLSVAIPCMLGARILIGLREAADPDQHDADMYGSDAEISALVF